MANYYGRFFDQAVNNLQAQVIKRMKDSNRMKSNLTDPHYRTIQINNVPRLPFAVQYGRTFNSDEIIQNDDKISYFTLETIERQSEILGLEHIIKVHSTGDVSLICQWSSINESKIVTFIDGKSSAFDKG